MSDDMAPRSLASTPRATQADRKDAEAVLTAASAATSIDDRAAVMIDWRKLSPDARALTRKVVARAIDVAVADLSGNAEKCRGERDAVELIKAHDLWPDPVDGAELLDAIVSMLGRFLSLPPHAAEAIALWTVHTHAQVLEAFDFAPYLNPWSPVRRCGKTTLMNFLRRLCARPFAVSGITAAALFRTIDGHRPTVLIDEGDKIFANPKDNADLIGCINAGNERGAVIPRCEGDDFKVRAFGVFAPYVVAGIGSLPDTITDRSVPIAMQRKPKGKKLERRTRATWVEVWRLGERSAKWAAVNLETLRAAGEAEVDIEALDDRACDIWTPLLAVAAVAGGDWPGKARTAALALSGGRDLDDDSAKARILRDIKAAFDTDDDGKPLAEHHKALATEDIVRKLNLDKESPWPGWNNGKGLNDRGVAGLLKSYDIRSKKVTALSGVRLQGYERTAFLDAWASYADESSTPQPEPEPDNGLETHNTALYSAFDRTSSQTALNKGNPASGWVPTEAASRRGFSGNLGSKTTRPDQVHDAAVCRVSDPSQCGLALSPTRSNLDAFRTAQAQPPAAPDADFEVEI